MTESRQQPPPSGGVRASRPAARARSSGSSGGDISDQRITAELTDAGLRVRISGRQVYDPAGRRTSTSVEAGDASRPLWEALEANLRDIAAAEQDRLLGRLGRDVAAAREAAIRAGEAPGWEEG